MGNGIIGFKADRVAKRNSRAIGLPQTGISHPQIVAGQWIIRLEADRSLQGTERFFEPALRDKKQPQVAVGIGIIGILGKGAVEVIAHNIGILGIASQDCPGAHPVGISLNRTGGSAKNRRPFHIGSTEINTVQETTNHAVLQGKKGIEGTTHLFQFQNFIGIDPQNAGGDLELVFLQPTGTVQDQCCTCRLANLHRRLIFRQSGIQPIRIDHLQPRHAAELIRQTPGHTLREPIGIRLFKRQNRDHRATVSRQGH